MNAPNGLLKGPKFNKQHSTVNEKAIEVIKILKPYTEVKKIVLGPIKPIRTRRNAVKLTMDGYTVKIQCRDYSSVQVLWVHAPLAFCREKLK